MSPAPLLPCRCRCNFLRRRCRRVIGNGSCAAAARHSLSAVVFAPSLLPFAALLSPRCCHRAVVAAPFSPLLCRRNSYGAVVAASFTMALALCRAPLSQRLCLRAIAPQKFRRIVYALLFFPLHKEKHLRQQGRDNNGAVKMARRAVQNGKGRGKNGAGKTAHHIRCDDNGAARGENGKACDAKWQGARCVLRFLFTHVLCAVRCNLRFRISCVVRCMATMRCAFLYCCKNKEKQQQRKESSRQQAAIARMHPHHSQCKI